MVLAVQSRTESPEVRAGVYRLLGRVQAVVVAPGALITVLSGVWLTMSLAWGGGGAALGRPGLATMQGMGIVAGLLVLLVALPTASRLARAAVPDANGQLPTAFEKLRRRQALVSSVAGALALMALLGATLF
jgi:hypothetical protein